MNLCRLALPLLVALLPSNLTSQSRETLASAALAPRLHGEIQTASRATLPGSASPRTLHAQDLGPVPGSHPLQGITLVFRRSPAQQAELDQLLLDQQNPSSPEFHHWLTPEAFGDRFGVAQQDLDTTTRWLTSEGFTVTGISRAHDRLTFSGTAAEVQAAFGSPLHRFLVDGEPHIAPASNLSLPADLAAITTAVLHLSDFRPQPQSHPARPQFTSLSTQAHYLSPPDLATMYHQNSTLGGAGLSLAIVGQSYLDPANLVNQFQIITNGFLTPVNSVLVPGTGVLAISPGDESESEIDLEYSSGIAPGAALFDVYVGSNPNYNAFDALTFVINEDFAQVISVSYAECETLLSPTDLAQGDALFQQASAQGQSIVAASGDAGSAACVPFNTSSQLSSAEQQALAVNYPADSTNVTAVGGTQMAPGTFAAGASTFWSPALTQNGTHTLLSYVPEVTWNEDALLQTFASGGGGASASFSQPAWQAGFPGIPSGSARLLPDLALQASIRNPGFVLCTADQDFLANQGQTSSCVNGLLGSNGNPTIGGGTSFAAPVFAGLLTLLNQQRGEFGQGNVNPTLYHLATTSPSIFHDITSGSNACTPGLVRCSAAGQSGFSAQVGFDEATGLGSLDFGAFLSALATTPPSKKSIYMTVIPDTNNPGLGASTNVSIVLSGDTTPTGYVTVRIDGSVIAPNLPIAPGASDVIGTAVANITVLAPQTPGSHVLTVAYPGDATYAPAQVSTSILVGLVRATGSIALSAGNITLPANGSSSTTVTIDPTGGYNGRLTWRLSVAAANSSSPGTSGCYSIPSVVVDGTTTTTLTLGTGSACGAASPAARPQNRSQALRTKPPLHPWRSLPALSSLSLLGLLPLARRRRPGPILCLLLALAPVATALSGCGSGVNSSSGGGTTTPTPTPQTATYTVSLTGTDSVATSISSTTTFTLTIQ